MFLPEDPWEKCGSAGGVPFVLLSERELHLSFLAPCEPHVHRNQYRKHRDREKGRPLYEEPEHYEHEPDVLRVTHERIRPADGEGASALSLKEHLPGGRGEDEAAEDQRIAEEVERAQVGVSLEAQKGIPEVSPLVGEGIGSGKSAPKPSRQKVDGEGETVHLREEGDDECGEGAEGPIIAGVFKPPKAQSEDDEDRRVYQHERP